MVSAALARSRQALALALKLARRDLRGGFSGLAVFVACLALGVAAIAGVGSLSASVLAALGEDARALLGGDVELRLTHRPIDDAQRRWLAARARAASDTVQMRAMVAAADETAPALIELKAVDESYPLFGTMVLDPPITLDQALADDGAAVEPALLARLGIALGARIAIGEQRFTVRATISREPDRMAGEFNLGPRVMIARSGLERTGLVKPGSMIRYHHRVALADGAELGAVIESLRAQFPQADWRLRDARDAQPGFRHFVERLTLYLVLVGLTALLVGGIGVAGATGSHLDAKTTIIATLKCLGAPPGLIFRVYLVEVLILAGAGIAIGIVIGAVMPWALAPLIGERLPLDPRPGLYLAPLARAVLFGLLTTLVFTLWPLARAAEQPAAGLFRHIVMPVDRWPPPIYVAASLALLLALAALALVSAGDVKIGGWFIAGALASLLVFRVATWFLVRVVDRIARGRRGVLRLGLANLSRPGASTPLVVLSLGIGLTVLVAIALVEGNLSHQVQERLPERAPAFFFIDIQPDQLAAVERLAVSVEGVDGFEQVPMVRGRIAAINGRAIEQAAIDPSAQWMVRGDIGFTYAAEAPPRARLVEGKWWPSDYRGPPLVSFDEDGARGFKIGVGDRLTFNIMGRSIEAEIANLRRIDWEDFGINFLVIFAPGALEVAPHSHIATVRATPAAEAPLLSALGRGFNNVSAIPVRGVLEEINRIVGAVADALRSTASITLISGLLVLGGVIAAGRRRRRYDAVVLKVLGATRREVGLAYLIEFAAQGALSAVIASVLGSIAGWLFVTQVMEDEWLFLPWRVALTIAAGVGLTAILGFLGTWRALGQRPAPLLRID